ncbi:DUF6893 family small protein [Actinomadura roseirufa]|nr:hypothetical protein [Actinomadura roseirufa]
MSKDVQIGPGPVRLVLALLVLSVVVIVLKELPAIRRYLKVESM